MSPSDFERLAALVPGTGELAIELLSRGLHSATYRARRDGILYAVKIKSDAATEVPAERCCEVAVLKSAAQGGFAPRLIASDPGGGFLVLEWLEGRPMGEAAAKRPDAKFAMLLNRVHQLPLPGTQRVMSARAWIEHYDRQLKQGAFRGSAARSRRAATMLKGLEAQGPPPKPCVCHSDLHRLNVLVRGPGPSDAELALLDWEYAHVSEPLWDLAGWSANNDLGAGAQGALLAAYYGRPPTVQERERLALLFWLYDYVCLQWIALYVTRSGAAGSAFVERARALERRLDSPVYGTIAVPTNF